MKRNLVAVALVALLIGCASFTRNVYNTENLAVDAVTASVHAFNLYYQASTNGAGGNEMAMLNSQRDQIYAATKKFQATASAVDQARLAYTANAADTNLTTLQVSLNAFLSQQTNVLNLIRLYTAH